MNIYLQCFVTLPLLVLTYQVYLWILSLKGVERQRHCRVAGVIYTTAGTVSFLFRSIPFTVLGLILFMLGLLLIARGLDRLDKSIFIDRFDGDR